MHEDVAAGLAHDPAQMVLQLKERLAAEIMEAVNARQLTTRRAEELTGLPAADFSRLRGRQLARFSVDRLLTVLLRFDCDIDIRIMHAPPLPQPDLVALSLQP